MTSHSKELSFWDKFSIYASTKTYSYDKRVDEIITRFMKDGKIVYHDSYSAYILYKDKYYGLWIANFPYASLNLCEVCEKRSEKFYQGKRYLWYHLRPSRKVEIQFFNWFYGITNCEYDLRETNDLKKRNNENLNNFLKEDN